MERIGSCDSNGDMKNRICIRGSGAGRNQWSRMRSREEPVGRGEEADADTEQDPKKLSLGLAKSLEAKLIYFAFHGFSSTLGRGPHACQHCQRR